ncbi:flagellar biosynthesis protein FlhB [Pseudooceanicola sediminis]|uniref:Flagellar biosynthesis protein FlhB n=1 Tax=Pseudooceanicola sediminis TaxID=2211117 RepID=A0A399J4L5_9RHOB|nr:flagellar type III secretion system protein FlhB [Pseudooceanicola sediminis]KAA2315578.1 flagellar biosynthesis protein FlhB [Puniceibacterium sp. HSS470]RII40221.1 flagellar biosynthesis protein FlhB [Pseudooceanicola sediminis]|tara:strand:+ start:11238 stop:12326 length:1089 start_codon:yes stop_codon:yes gene_type:complete
MAEDDQSSEKPHEPTQRKLQKAREQGEVPRSNDLSTAAAYGGLCIAGVAVGGPALIRLGGTLQSLIDRPESLAPLYFDGAGTTPTGGLMASVALSLLPFFLVPAVAALTAVIAQQAFVVSADKIRPKLSRISVISNAKNKFGRGGLFEFFKSFAKLLIYSACLYFFVSAKLPEMINTLYLGPGITTATLLRLCIEFLFIVFLISLVIGGVDFLWQRAEHMRKNRMSDKDMRDEFKDSEGDPHMKQQRRQRGQEIANSQMMADLPKADVVIVNPTHYAVALKWDRTRGSAPVCLAKGVDEVAAVMRRIAGEHAIPIHSDPPTARKLHATVEIGDQIDPDDYRAVAAAIRFADQMRSKAKGRIR